MNTKGLQMTKPNLVNLVVSFVIGWLLIALLQGRPIALP
jgi:hypothetical protein